MLTNSRNAHSGFIGIYFLGELYYELFNISDYRDYRSMSRAIIDCVWKAWINRSDSSQNDWNRVLSLRSRQKIDKWQNTSISSQEELKLYIHSFDSENAALREKIDMLSRQNTELHTQLDTMRTVLQNKSAGILQCGQERDLYPGEQLDLLISILQQTKELFDDESRAYQLISSLLSANTPIGECRRLIASLKELFNGDYRLSSVKKAQLKALDFTIGEDGGHYKLTFHDPRYMFTVSKSPSDHREGKNLYSEMCRVLNVNKKIL